MEKEKSILENNIEANFFFEEFDPTVSELKDYIITIKRVLKAFDHFIKTDLEIDKKFNVNITLCSDEKIIELNDNYRDKNKVTDVLSFPLQEDMRSGDYDKLFPEIELGDLFICHSICEKQAVEFNITYFDEWIHLMVHGLLHLVGYDHEISLEEQNLMESFEKKIIDNISENI